MNATKLDYEQHLKQLFADLRHSKTGEDFGMPAIVCSFSMDAIEWKRLKAKGLLGQVYNTDLSNHLSRLGVLNEYCVPLVSDRDNARKGRKYIRVEFRLSGHPYR